MKKQNVIIVILLFIITTSGVITGFTYSEKNHTRGKAAVFNAMKKFPAEEKPCVFKTIFGEEPSDSNFIYKTPAKVSNSIDDALAWISKAQLSNGGWGAGTHANQGIYDPHAVKADPATTAMVAMALLRIGNTPTTGTYAGNLALATDYLIKQVENTPEGSLNITDETGTQPQVKLGQNIDVVLTTQYFTNLMDHLNNNPNLKGRIKKCLDKCVAKIQAGQNSNGSSRGEPGGPVYCNLLLLPMHWSLQKTRE